MRLTIKATKIKINAAVTAMIEEKISHLARVLKRFETHDDVPVRVEVFPISHKRHGNIVEVTVTASLPTKTISIHTGAPDVLSGIDIVRKILQREIVKFKDKKIKQRA